MNGPTPLQQHDDIEIYGGDEGVDRFLPPELLLDHEDPSNDRYFRYLANIRVQVDAQCRKCKPRQVQAARMAHQGSTNSEIVKKLGYTHAYVSKLLTEPKIQDLIAQFRRVAAFIEGPNLSVRKNMLWRIAANNEMTDPAIAINSLKELSKLEGAYPNRDAHPNASVTIVINQDQMPKTALDQPLILEHDPHG